MRLSLGMIGGGEGAFIGGVHRMAARTPVFPRIVRPEDQPGEIPVGRLEEGMHGAVGSEYQVSGRRAA